MDDIAARAVAPVPLAAETTLPLTERVMARLPGPRLLWMPLWATWFLLILLVLRYVVPGQLPVFFEQEETTLASGAVTSYTMLVMLWALGKLGRDVAALGPTVVRLTGGRLSGGRPFRAMGSVWGPLILMSSLMVPYSWDGFLKSPSLASALSVLAAFVGWLPLMTFAWVAGAMLLGLHRLGGTPLHLTSFEVDRSLGLRPFGFLAFTPLLAIAAAFIPLILITGLTDIRDVMTSLGLLIIILLLFFASLRRLRGQLLAAKARYLAWARDLYAQALHPVRAEGGVAALRAGALELVAAESIERPAAAIQEWPFDEGILRAIAAIVTSVTTAILARLILSRIGL